jgi:radical SAM protein with 4Fe4S-binding SPASM domain
MNKAIGYARVGYAWKVAKSPIVNYVPQDVSIELTNTCNFSCSFCPQSDPNHFNVVTRSALVPEKAAILLAKLRAGGVTTNVIHWTLDGEPFVNKHIVEIFSLAIEHDWRHFIFSTNGFFCTPERIDSLPSAGGQATYVLSIDFCSDKALFEQHRGTPNSWEKVRDNIQHILASPSLSHVSLQVTDISSFAIHDHAELRQRLTDLQNCFPKSERLRIGSRIFHNATGHVSGLLEEKKTTSTSYNLCPYPWTSMVIASNGDVVACCRDLQHKTVLGNLFKEDLMAIWNGEKYQAMRKALAERRPEAVRACANCDMPYDQGKFTMRHILQTGIERLGILKS